MIDRALRDWCEPRRIEVVRLVEHTLDELAHDAAQRRLLQLARPVLAGRAAAGSFCPAIHLPLLTCAAVGGKEEAALVLAAATTILELSMDLLDRVWDEETDQTWPGQDPRIIEMAGIVLMVSIVPLALARVPTRPARVAELQQTVAQRLLRIAAGEMLDVATLGRSDVTIEQALNSTTGKSGERRALYAVLGAMLGGASTATERALDEMGRHYGVARQIASDVFDLTIADHSRDLASGSRTWPIAWMLSQVHGGEREALSLALERARHDATDAAAVRQQVTRLGAGVRGYLEVELACQRALVALNEAHPDEPAAGQMRAMLAAASRQGVDWNDAAPAALEERA